MSKNNAKSVVHNVKKRDPNLDLIRCVAIYSLISLHFFWNSGFYQVAVTGWQMYVLTAVRTASMICIPLFLMLTGFLMCKKEFSLKYYRGIARILVIHFLCIILCYMYIHFFRHEHVSVKTVILGIFSNQFYSWYIGLYMGLFCLIPFLNIFYNGLDSRFKKRVLLLTLVGLTAMPSLGNYFTRLWPDFFAGIYPITYYFIGVYIREYEEDYNKWYALGLFLLAVILSSIANSVISYNEIFKWTQLADWGGIENTLAAPMLFIFLRRLNLKAADKGYEAIFKIIAKISEWSLGMYLLSWIFDQYAYGKLAAAVPSVEGRWKYYFVMVAFVFICSAVLSAIVNVISKLILKLFDKACVSVSEKSSVKPKI